MAVTPYPLYLTGEQVSTALRKSISSEMVANGVQAIESSDDNRFDPASLHTPGTYIVEYVTGILPDGAEQTHPLMLYVTSNETGSGDITFMQRMIVGNNEYYRYSYTNGESWTNWTIKSVPGVEEMTAEDCMREVIVPVFGEDVPDETE